MKPMTSATFATLGARDFTNGAVLDEIRAALVDREALLDDRMAYAGFIAESHLVGEFAAWNERRKAGL